MITLEKNKETENKETENKENKTCTAGNWGNEAFAEKYDGLGINDYTFEEYASYELGY